MAKLSVEKRLLQAQSLMRKGALQEARHAAQSVLQDFPANKKAKQLLAKIEQTRSAGPVTAPQADQEKIAHLVRLFESGDVLGAADLASRYTKQFPRSALVWNVAAAANKVLGRSENAIECFERVVQINPTDADAHFNLGVLLQEEGRLRAAADSYRRTLALRPEDAEAHNNLGKAVQDLGNLYEAKPHFERAAEIDPRYSKAHYNMGSLFQEMGNSVEAVKSYARAISLDPENYEAYHNMGAAYLDHGKSDEAIAAYEAALAANPDEAKSHNGLGAVMMALGRQEEAIACFEKAIALSPGHAKAHRNLSLVKTFTEGDPQLDALLHLHATQETPNEDKIHICFAIAKAYEDMQDLQKSFAFLEEGNNRRKTQLKYSFEADEKLFAAIRSFDYSKPLDVGRGDVDPIPIFIVGMPRSGTTLTEQIISNHHLVFGAGELGMVSQFGIGLVEGKTPNTTEKLLEFRDTYLSFLSEVSDGQPYVTDKLPHNFRFIPLIRKLFPNAAIVHTKRDARAVCWSNFKLHFPAKGLGYSNDLGDVVSFYNLYRDLMKEWAEAYGDHIVQVDYEKLTRDQETETRRLIDRVGLEWDENCLSPHKNKRLARTASYKQVRQKVYTGSSEKWKAYEAFLGDAFNTL